ncbi:alpha/beta hydrolase [Mycobacterium nebraskense]|uniref:alpha/beta hydrolase n=1 Tax=Mycobacterium nebraskense TaxID=244292 RepID=UPI0021F34C52|nr:alpha/beta hydrolase [Mycobacterium nebraskense]MCV7121209.1 alpha/beta hydrolase [Mycobacterium nebraskense]
MSKVTRGLGLVREATRELGMLLPRTVAGLNQSTGWAPASPRGARQFGEVLLDELVLSGFSLLGGSPAAIRPLDGCTGAAEELSALGIDRAHADPMPLRPTSVRRRRIGNLAYERMAFEHDPALPKTLEAEGLGGPARAVVHLCRHDDGPRPWLIWVHGAGQGGTEDLLLSRIGRIHHQLGFNVALPVQPGHGCRRRELPAYPDMDPLGNVAGMMRAVSEIRAVVRWAQPQATAVVVAGISMGTPVAALGFRDLLASPEVAKLTSVIDPLRVDPAPPPERRLIVGAWHDRMAMREPAVALQERWGGELYWYDGSHVGHIFSRRVQRVTDRFLRTVAG